MRKHYNKSIFIIMMIKKARFLMIGEDKKRMIG